MVIKDWKKTRDDNYRTVWKNNFNKRIVSIEDEGSEHSKNRYAFHSGIENDYIDVTKYFDSKKEALDFAKEYMREN